MRIRFTRYAVWLLLLCLCNCAKEKDFPYQHPYPVMKIVHAAAENDGIKVSAEIISAGTAGATEYGFIYFLHTKPQEKIRVQVPVVKNKIDLYLKERLIQDGIYEFSAYAIAKGKTVLTTGTVVTSLTTSMPVIAGFSPQEGPPNTVVTITGANFTNQPDRVSVFIGEEKASVLSADYTKLVVKVPHKGYFGSYPIQVFVNDVECLSEKTFNIWGPELLRMSKYEGMPGDTVTLFGNHLSLVPQVRVQGAYFKVISGNDTKVKLEVPLGNIQVYDTPLPVSITANEQMATSTFSFTIRSNFSPAPALTLPGITGNSQSVEMGGKGYFFQNNRVISFDSATGTWREESRCPGKVRQYPVWQRVGNKAYLLSSTVFNNEVWEYDIQTASWQRLPDLPFSVSHPASFVLDGKIYLTGGQNFSYSNLTLWRYDPVTHEVVALSDLPVHLVDGSTFVRNGTAYALVGQDMLAYHQSSDTWKIDSQTGVGSGRAFIVGGSEVYLLPDQDKGTLYHYKTSSKLWEIVAYYPGCVDGLTGFATNNVLYIGTLSPVTVSCRNNFYSYRP